MHISLSPVPLAAETTPGGEAARASAAVPAGGLPGSALAGFLRLAAPVPQVPQVATHGQGSVEDAAGRSPRQARALLAEEDLSAIAVLATPLALSAAVGQPVAPGPPGDAAGGAAAMRLATGAVVAPAPQGGDDAAAPPAATPTVAVDAAPPPLLPEAAIGVPAPAVPVSAPVTGLVSGTIAARAAPPVPGGAAEAAAPEARVAVPNPAPQPMPVASTAPPGVRAPTMADPGPGQATDLPGLAAPGRLSAHGPMPPVPMPPEAPVARHVAAQIALQATPALTPGGPATLELRLDPPELGQVRMTLGLSDQGVTLHLVADRPETLDLLRRHVALLGEEFARQGLGASSFTFAESGARDSPGRSNARGDARGGGSSGTAAAPQAAAPALRPLLVATGLDIRL